MSQYPAVDPGFKGGGVRVIVVVRERGKRGREEGDVEEDG